MEVYKLHGMGRDGEIEGVRHVRDLHPLGHAAHAPDVRLNDVGPSTRDQLLEPILGVLVLACRHRDVNGLPHLGQALDVVGQHRLLEPAHLELLELLGHVDGLLRIVAVVGVDVDRHVVTEGLRTAATL